MFRSEAAVQASVCEEASRALVTSVLPYLTFRLHVGPVKDSADIVSQPNLDSHRMTPLSPTLVLFNKGALAYLTDDDIIDVVSTYCPRILPGSMLQDSCHGLSAAECVHMLSPSKGQH